MEQEFYNDEEIEILREQLRRANQEARELWKDVTINPRIAEEIERRKNLK